MAALSWTFLVVLCYLLGSAPSAYLAARLLRGVDVRALGDGNAGAANVWRQFGLRAGVAVFTVDAAKGAGAVLVARALADGQAAPFVGGLAAIAGHNWPVYLGFRGGRGASTLVGVLMALWPLAGIPLTAVSLVPMALTRSTIPALAFVYILFPLVAWATGASPSLILCAVLLMLLVGCRHWATGRAHAADKAPTGVLRPGRW